MATRTRRQGLACILLGFALLAPAVSAELVLQDDAGRSVRLAQPAQRIISLAPHLTELLFAAGAGKHLVGTVEYSNYPLEANRITRVGDNARLDLERIVALKPDLVAVWRDGNAQRQLDKLLHLGIPVFYNEPRRLPDIGRAIEQFGKLAGTETVAQPAARAYAERLKQLRMRYAGRAPVSIFFQIWDRPLMTVSGAHLISDVIALCGGRNVFADLKPLTPQVTIENVLAADPEMLISVSAEAGQDSALHAWKQWPRLKAVARNNLYSIDSDLISRNSPRILEGAAQICAKLEQARVRRE